MRFATVMATPRTRRHGGGTASTSELRLLVYVHRADCCSGPGCEIVAGFVLPVRAKQLCVWATMPDYKNHNVMRPSAAARYNGIAIGRNATALSAEVGCATPHR